MALQLFYISFSSNGELKTSICQQNQSFARLEFTKWRSIFIAPSSFALFLATGGLSIEYTMFIIYFYDIKTLLCLIIVAMFLRLRETHNALQLRGFFFFFLFLLFFCQRYQEYRGIRRKKLFYRQPNS